MTSALSPCYDVRDIIKQNTLFEQVQHQQQNAQHRNAIGGAITVTRNRNSSIGNFTPVNGYTPVIIDNDRNGLNDHMMLDRSYNEPCDRILNNNNMNLNNEQKQPAVNSSRYKTELCRPFEESGHCKYADKCQFAHGTHELKQLQRHPKYKTELCRTFHSMGFCPYGPRCNFVHNECDIGRLNDKNNHLTAQAVQQIPSQQYLQHISPPDLSQSSPTMVQRPKSINFNSSYNGSYGSSADSSPPSSVGSESPVFFGEDNHIMNSGYTSLNNVLNLDNNYTSSVYNGLSDVTSLGLCPLKVQTAGTNAEMGRFSQQFHALLNLNNQSKHISVCDEWKSVHLTASPSSPDSNSGESVNSASNSFGSDNNFSFCGSPLECGKIFRLPVFNHISHD